MKNKAGSRSHWQDCESEGKANLSIDSQVVFVENRTSITTISVWEGGHRAELVTRTLSFIFIIPNVCVTSSFNPVQLMQVTDKLEVRVSQNFAGKEPTLVLKEEKPKRQDK